MKILAFVDMHGSLTAMKKIEKLAAKGFSQILKLKKDIK